MTESAIAGMLQPVIALLAFSLQILLGQILMKVATRWQPHLRKRSYASEYTQTTSTSFSGPLGEGTDRYFICTFSLLYGEVYTFVVFNSYTE